MYTSLLSVFTHRLWATKGQGPHPPHVDPSVTLNTVLDPDFHCKRKKEKDIQERCQYTNILLDTGLMDTFYLSESLDHVL